MEDVVQHITGSTLKAPGASALPGAGWAFLWLRSVLACRIRSPAKYSGFTLVELMVTLAIAAIIASIAVPSFQTSIANNAVKSAARDLVASINTARMQSMSTRSEVRVAPDDGGWGGGWLLDYATGAAEEDKVFTLPAKVSLARTDDNGALVFRARGGLEGGSATFTICHDTAKASGRTLTVSFLGKVSSAIKGDCP
jgi:type IV fimbrial biogenesis protein FimT